MADTIHPFEQAGLGKAPFRYAGMVEQDVNAEGARVLGSSGGVEVTTNPGGTCAYCGRAIIDMYTVRSSDGKRFVVGSDCIAKVGDVGRVDRLAADRKRIKAARDKARIEAARVALPMAETLASRPHPTAAMAAKGATLRDYCAWMFDHAGTSGMLAAARLVERALAPRVED